ncbi:hypothetical protein [Cetobacterium sp.]|uniref:hypothetical protein n=1 Tax=Cetobacterium sp. TaxID=2071632 RepID=UPI0025C3A9C8|nr:hypothetical protein [Cetobacterium sp.]
MKKILLVGVFVISAVSFANGHTTMENMNHGSMRSNTNHSSMKMMNGDMNCKMMGKMNMMNMTPELKKQMQDDMIKIQEKQLEINKIMNTTNPDMKKIEKLNNEIYQIKATHMTKMQQNTMKTN